jgi:hypothetical protein
MVGIRTPKERRFSHIYILFLILMKQLLRVVVPVLLGTFQAMAWGSHGHKLVASFAKAALNKQVVDSVQHFLGKMTFEETSVWMDEIKSDHSYAYMNSWHYVNIEKDATFVSSEDKNVLSQLELALSMLKHPERDFDKTVTALRLLFHLVGDIHQPLHCGYGSDRGGNELMVGFDGNSTNLHALWDTGIIEYYKISLKDCFKVSNGLSNDEKRKIQKIDVTEWMYECREFLPVIYDYKKRNISDDYTTIAKPIIEKQLTKAGIRLATILNLYFSRK